MEFLKWGQKQVRQFALNLTDTEVLVEEATNKDPWGPHGRDMAKISDEAMDPEKYREIMSVIARRLTDAPENWRHVYKALLLLEYLVKHGPMKIAKDTLSNSSLLIQLQGFDYKDETGKDYGLNVRNRSKELLSLVQDSDRLTEAREAARINRGKYTGTSKEDFKFRSSAGNYGQSLPKRVVYEKDEEEEEDPFEATRKRIEKLKSEQEAPIKLKVPKRKEVKKLSQVKVNPEIAKAFMKPAVPSIETQSAGFQAASDHMDLLGDLTEDHVSIRSAPAGTEDALDELIDPVSESMTGDADWAAFQESPAYTQPQPQLTGHSEPVGRPGPSEISLTDLLGQEGPGLASLEGRSMTSGKPGAMSSDPFADLCTPQSKSGIPIGLSTMEIPFSGPVVSQEMPQWQPPVLQQTTASTGFQARQPGAPMNPNAIQPPRTAPKRDPFANLGF